MLGNKNSYSKSMSGKCHHQMPKVQQEKFNQGSKYRWKALPPWLPEAHAALCCYHSCTQPAVSQTMIMMMNITKKVLQGYFLLCLIDVTLMLKLLAWGCSSTLSKKVERSKEPVIPGARLQIRICRRLLRFILRSWITTHFCSPSYLSSDK